MFSRPAKGTEKESQGIVRKLLLSLSILISVVCFLLMIFYKHQQTRAMTGELLNGPQGTLVSPDKTSFLSSPIDYFGAVAYLFPLLIVYATYKLVYKKISLKSLDFFVIGNEGAGGILGDFLNIYFFQKFPHVIAVATPLILTLIGLFAFTHKSPMWFCESIGDFICGFIPFLNKNEVKKGHKEDKKDNLKTKNKQDKASFDEDKSQNKGDSLDNHLKTHDKEPTFGDENEPLKSPPHLGGINLGNNNEVNNSYEPPRFYNGPEDQNSPTKTEQIGPDHKIEPLFGGNDFVKAPPPPPKNFVGQKPQEPSYASKEELAAASNLNTAEQYKEKEDRPLYYSPNQGANSFNAKSSLAKSYNDSQAKESEDNRPSTYITGLGVNSKNKNVEAKDDGVSHTLITKTVTESAVKVPIQTPKAENDLNEKRTIVTIGNPVAKKTEVKEEEPPKSNEKSTIVTRYIAPLKTAKEVHNENTEGKKEQVSTVITRTVPLKDVPLQNVNTYPNSEGFGGGFSESREHSEHSAFVPSYEEGDDNVISFNEISKEKQSIEVDKLSGAFVPTSGDLVKERDSIAQKYDDNALRADNRSFISEKDQNYGALSQGTRGVMQRTSTEDGSLQAKESYDSNYYSQTSFNESNTVNHKEEVKESFGYDFTKRPESADPTKFPTKNMTSSQVTVPHFPYDDWRPSFNLLKLSDGKILMDDATIEEMIGRIDQFLNDFKIKARVAHYMSGPVITRYDLLLEPGVKSSTLRGVSQDLCRNLMVRSVRILDVIPGTPYLGLELPNPKRQLITLGDVVTRPEFVNTRASLPMCLGVNAVGVPVVANLAQAPHLLICGTTGSGKSAGVNAMILSLLLTCSPSELRLILIDPKQVEFSLYEGLPHLLTPIITEPEEALAAMAWLVSEMESRYSLIRAMRVHQLDEVNEIIKNNDAQGKLTYDPSWTADMGGNPPVLRPLPKIVLIIDEFADLMVTSSGKKGGNGFETALRRIVAKARAAGIHLIMATQTPRAEIVTGVVKANMPSRIAYTVQNGMDSRVILDESGAEDLLGNGDMLVKYQKLENSQTFRAHGPFASNSDVKAIVRAWIDRAGDPEYVEGVTDFTLEDESESKDNSSDEASSATGLDKIFDEVAAYARDYVEKCHKSPPVSDIQVNFNVGYARAKRLKMQLVREGVIDD